MNLLNKDLGNCLHNGWSSLESNFFWSESRYASIILPIKSKKKKIGIQFIVEPFLQPGKVFEQNLELFINGIYCYGKSFNKVEQEIIFLEVDSSLLFSSSLKIDFIFPNSVSPALLGLSNDERRLGFKLFEINII
ncbi:hypothetical protein [Polynucleobacter alcilacus]|uniref:hypothetical protein n=1 Tax=Polynucleobacter alcilacus TaxID=1819739 RepID=UPI001C0B1323|nr:hypothetical protein [Polynucleobacter alcilacus]MBU3568572.1 hypothetical protein [Polynucleobacter alcilacus]